MVRCIRKHYIEVSLPGYPCTQYDLIEVKERNVKLVKMPELAFAYRFLDQLELSISGKTIVKCTDNVSPLTYLGGTMYTLEEIKTQFPEYDVLIENMEHNGWKRMVKTSLGNWQPLNEEDIII